MKSNKRLITRFVILTIYIIISSAVSQGAVITIDSRDPVSKNITGEIEYFEDTTKKLSIENITVKKDGWSKIEDEWFNYGYSRAAFWFHFTIVIKEQLEEDLFVVSRNPLYNSIIFYKPGIKENYHCIKTGDSLPFSNKEIPYNTYIFSLHNSPGSYEYFIRIESDKNIGTKFHLLSRNSLIKNIHSESALIWSFYAILLVMAFYNLFIFISTRDKTYFYFVVLTISIFFYRFIVHGHAFQYFWPNSLPWFSDFFSIIFFLIIAAVVLFIQSYLETEKNLPLFNKLLIYTILFPTTLITIISFFISFGSVGRYISLLVLYLSVTSLVFSIYGTFKGMKSARFLLTALGIFFIGAGGYASSILGLIKSNSPIMDFFRIWAFEGGVVSAIVLLSIGLADKINTMKNELKKMNISLEHKVEERTEDLSATMHELNQINEELTEERNKLHERNELIAKELDLARKIQQQLMPEHPPGEDIAAFYKPMDETGGDFYDFIRFRDTEKTGIFISDVSGHGVSAAFITAMIKTLLLQSGRHKEDPAALLTYLNESLYGTTAGNFITALYAIYDPTEKKLLLANAGHNFPYIIYENEIVEIIKSKSPPLAILDNEDLKIKGKLFINHEIDLKNAKKLIFYTDGLVETRNIKQGNDYFEFAGMMEVFRALENEPSNDFIKKLYNELLAYRGSDNFEDDICIICVDL